MNKIQKLIILILLSLSVYYIYYKNNNNQYHVFTINDNYIQKNNKISYIDYYKKDLLHNKNKVIINNDYSKNTQSINNLLSTIKNTSEIKAQLLNSDQLIISLGYNDLIYNIALNESITEEELNKIIKTIQKDYNNMIKEIKKYYHKPIIVIGYYKTNNENNNINKGIIKLNKVLKNNKNVYYIDTYYLLNYYNKYKNNIINKKFQNIISNKIISKILEIS